MHEARRRAARDQARNHRVPWPRHQDEQPDERALGGHQVDREAAAGLRAANRVEQRRGVRRLRRRRLRGAEVRGRRARRRHRRAETHLRVENARLPRGLDESRQREDRAQRRRARGRAVLRPLIAGKARRRHPRVGGIKTKPLTKSEASSSPTPSRRPTARAGDAALPPGPRKHAPAALARGGERLRGVAEVQGHGVDVARALLRLATRTASSTSSRRPSPLLAPLSEQAADREVLDDALTTSRLSDGHRGVERSQKHVAHAVPQVPRLPLHARSQAPADALRSALRERETGRSQIRRNFF